MLSRTDIEKELGKGLNIVPLHRENIKGNSINFTVSRNAWSLGNGQIVKDSNGKWRLSSKVKNGTKKYNIVAGKSGIIEDNKKKLLVLLPHTTTIVESSEVIGVGNYLGGTLHSKVGIVAKGVGDISTMLGPGFCGHLMLSLHNVTNEVVTIGVGETFVSLVFYYLKTPEGMKNTNISGHVDKLSELGIAVDQATRIYLTADWKMSLSGIRDEMKKSEEYKKFLEEQKIKQNENIKAYINIRNVLIVIIYIVIFAGAFFICKFLDNSNQNNVWMERYWTVLSTGIIVPFILYSTKFLKRN